MGKKESCYLCGLESDYLPAIPKDMKGISCNRCGDYYIDGLLVACGEPKSKEDKAILSGYTRWEKELENQIPEIHEKNYEKIIQDNKNYSDLEKVDKLLLYYSKKYPKKGSSANYDFDLDRSLTYSATSDEFLYFLKDVADKKMGYLKILAKGLFKIEPKGWARIEWLKKIKLANEKYNIEREKINKEVETIEYDLKEKAGVVNMRWSTPLARSIRDSYFQGTKEKLEKKLDIDKQVILGSQVITKDEDVGFLFGRLKKLSEFEKIFLAERLKEVYQDCRQQDYFKHDIKEILIGVDKTTEGILVDLKVGGLKGEKVEIPELPERDISTLIEMDESIQLEFKSTFQWDIRLQQKNLNLRNEVIKTIAAFNNTEGGYLLIGVVDDKKIFGLEKDYTLFKRKQNKDVFLQTLTHEIENKISKDFATRVDVKFYNLENKDICRIKVKFGDEPIWVKEDKDKEVFYVRLQNLTKDLTPSESLKYIKERWRNT